MDLNAFFMLREKMSHAILAMGFSKLMQTQENKAHQIISKYD